MVFLSPLGLGARVIGRGRHRRRLHSSRIVKPKVVNNTVSSRFQLKPHGQKRKQQLEKKKSRGNKSSIFNFNDDDEDILAREILSRLPVKSLVRFKCVCKYWLFLIEQDMTFINLHLERSRARPGLLIANFIRDNNNYQLMTADLFLSKKGGALSSANFHTVRELEFTSCDLMLIPVHGLIGFFSERRINPGVCICNFSTRESTPWIESNLLRDVLKKDVYAPRRDYQIATCTLGYDPATKEHKVVGIWRSYQPSYEVCEVLTVGENQWRQIDEVPPYRLQLFGSSVYINGLIYYSTNMLMESQVYNKDKSKFIVAFDVGREKFKTIRVPNYIFDWPDDYDSPYMFYNVDLFDLGGRLGLLINVAKDGYTTKLWIFNDDGNKKKSTNSWTEVTIELPRDPFGYYFNSVSGTDQTILTSYDESSDGKKSDTTCHSYNWKQKSFNEIEIRGIPSIPYLSSGSRVATFVENLLPVQKRRSSYEDWGVDELIVEDSKKRQVGGN